MKSWGMHMSTLRAGLTLAVAGLVAACATQVAGGGGAAEAVYETNVTNNLNLFSGEPEITFDRSNPRNLAIVEFTLGSDKRPAWRDNPLMNAPTVEDADESMSHLARVMISNDGGNTWHARPSPISDRALGSDHEHAPGGGDPMIESGPDGSLYVAALPFPRSPGQRGNMPKYGFVMAYSKDWGKTFAPPVQVVSPVDRPFIRVDQSTGKVYSASTGQLNPQTLARNQPVDGAIMDRWIIVWQPHLSSHSEPRRIGGPDFSGASSTHVVSHGIIASTFVLGGPSPGMGPPSAAGTPVPASLQGVMKDGVQTCSMAAPCLFFQTSSDDALHWTRHHVVVPGGAAGYSMYLSADEGQPGRYAIGMLSATNFKVMVTNDSGLTWSSPVTVVQATADAAPVAAPTAASAGASSADAMMARMMAMMRRSVIFKPWMAYGPSGVLGVMWRQKRDDVPGPPQPPQGPGIYWGPGYDIYAAISCDGGGNWSAPLRINAETSPNGPAGQDDLSYLTLDKQYAHLVWGDRRYISKITNVPTGQGGVQAFYGRVPFSVASKGAKCGR
jgi:hypothetical protein